MAQVAKRRKLTYKVSLSGGQKRLRELIVYIADQSKDDPKFGATKLNKILYHADFRSFATYGKPVTGTEYQRLERGPAPVALVPLRRDMAKDGDIVLRRTFYMGRPQDRVIPLRDPDLTLFSGRDIAIVNAVIKDLWNDNATEVSDGSHGIAWRTRYDGDRIPYESAYLSDESVTEGDISRTQELARELKWNASSARS